MSTFGTSIQSHPTFQITYTDKYLIKFFGSWDENVKLKSLYFKKKKIKDNDKKWNLKLKIILKSTFMKVNIIRVLWCKFASRTGKWLQN